jgi:hypothetical protein
MLVEMLCRTQSVKQVQIINGLKKGNITKALNGEHVGKSFTRTKRGSVSPRQSITTRLNDPYHSRQAVAHRA